MPEPASAAPSCQHFSESVACTTLPGVVDSPNYADCLRILVNTSWPAVDGDHQYIALSARLDSGYWIFGARPDARDTLTSVTSAFPDVAQGLNSFLRGLWPDGMWNALSVSRNCKMSPHRDPANALEPVRYTVSLGDFVGGALWLEDVEGDVSLFVPDLNAFLLGRAVVTRERPFSFDGSLWHASRPWSGERWVLTAYFVPDIDLSVLEGLGFPSTLTPPVALPCVPNEPGIELPAAPYFLLDICSGAHSPLASAAQKQGIPALAIDILLNVDHDLCNVVFFERLLRLAFSGKVRFGHGSPPCCEYSLLKLMPGPGPAPCRSPEHLNGFPWNDAAAKKKGGIQPLAAYAHHSAFACRVPGRRTCEPGAATECNVLARTSNARFSAGHFCGSSCSCSVRVFYGLQQALDLCD